MVVRCNNKKLWPIEKQRKSFGEIVETKKSVEISIPAERERVVAKCINYKTTGQPIEQIYCSRGNMSRRTEQIQMRQSNKLWMRIGSLN